MKYLKIFILWFISGLAVGGGLIYLLNPMAGLFVLLAILTFSVSVIAPIIHIIIESRNKENNTTKSMNNFVIVIGSVLILIIFLSSSGMFNFT